MTIMIANNISDKKTKITGMTVEPGDDLCKPIIIIIAKRTKNNSKENSMTIVIKLFGDIKLVCVHN